MLDTIRHQLKSSYLRSRMDLWPPLIERLGKEQKSGDFACTFTYCEAQYGYIGYLLSEKHKKQARQRIDETMKILDGAIRQFPDSARLYALRAAFIGYEIGLKPLKAPWLGPKNQENIEEAQRLNPREPRVWFEEGNSYFFRPAIFGGSPKTAIRKYEKAWALINAAPGAKQSWFYYYMGAWLGKAYLEADRKEEAYNLFRQLLSEVPDFRWVKDELLPLSQ
jgi:tetratricopeptide (TPR) repeat protein